MRAMEEGAALGHVLDEESTDPYGEDGEVVGLSIRIVGDDGPFDVGTRFELLSDQQVIGSAGTRADSTLLFPVELGDSPGLVLRKAADQSLPKRTLDSPRGPEVNRWPGPVPFGRRGSKGSADELSEIERLDRSHAQHTRSSRKEAEPEVPMISCLTATLDRWEVLRQAIDCYCAQTWPNKELLIATEGSEEYKSTIESHLQRLGRDDMRLIRLDGEHTLGKVRNVLLDEAAGELICQWDDDDLNHPERLRVQAEYLLSQKAKACFFNDQLQWFRKTGELFWTDWAQDRSGTCALIPGTLMMWSNLPVRYPEEGDFARSGEDTALMESLCLQFPVAQLRGHGFLSVYTFHGKNTFDLNHHRRIAMCHGADHKFLHAHRSVLREALADYQIPILRKTTVKTRNQEAIDLNGGEEPRWSKGQTSGASGDRFGATQSTRKRHFILIYNRMFLLDPDLDDMVGTEHYEFTEDPSRIDEAVAVIFHIPSLPDIEHLRKRPEQLWVAWWMECEINYPMLDNEEFMARFDLRMGYPLQSDISVTYVPPTLFEGEVGLCHPKSSTRLACSFISGYVDNSGRSRYLRELARYMDVHFYGRQGDRELVNDQGRHTKLSTVATYKFDLAFENTLAWDYVTEKFFDPLVAGAVPVYLGAENIADFAPTDHCYINVRNYPKPADLADHLKELGRYGEAYQELLGWRGQPLRPGFLDFYQHAITNPFQRLCHRIDKIRQQRRATS